MDQKGMNMVNLLSSNRSVIAGGFKTKGAHDVALAALVWALAKRQADAGRMRASYDYLKGQTSAFSAARSKNTLALVSRMAMSGNDEAYYAEAQRIYDKIKEGKMAGTSSRFGTALLIANNTSTPEEADELLERTMKIFAGMRDAHPVIVNERSMPFAAIIALTGRDEEELLADAEECYELLGKDYGLTKGRKTMAYVLAISELPPAQKVARVGELSAAFKAHKMHIGWGSTQEFVILAMLALDDRPADEIAADVAELDELIKEQKVLGRATRDHVFRHLCAAAISTCTHQDTAKVDAITDSIAIAVAQALVEWIVYVVVIAAVV